MTRSSAEWAGKRVLVTGATGFVGRSLVGSLVERGALVYAGTSPMDTPRPQPSREDVEPQALRFDIRDRAAVETAVDRARPDLVFHLAAVGVTRPRVDASLALMVNVGGVINLLESLRGRGVNRVVLAGTSYEYGTSIEERQLDPFNAYAASKVAAWAFGNMYWRAYGMPVVTVRPFQVYGPGQPYDTLIPAAVRTAKAGADFPMTPGKQVRDFIFVEDVAQGMLATADADGVQGRSLDLGTGTGHTVLSVVEKIWQLMKARGRIKAGALPYRTGAAVNLVADAEETARTTGWRAKTSLAEGLRVTIGQRTRGEQ